MQMLLEGQDIPYYYILKLGKMLQNLSSAAVVIGALRVNQPENLNATCRCCWMDKKFMDNSKYRPAGLYVSRELYKNYHNFLVEK